MAAADALYEVMSLMVKKGPLSRMVESEDEKEEVGEYTIGERGQRVGVVDGLKMW